MGLQVGEEGGGEGGRGPEEGVVVGEGGEEHAEEEGGCCRGSCQRGFLGRWEGDRRGGGGTREKGDIRATIINVANDPELGARFGSSNVLRPKKLIFAGPYLLSLLRFVELRLYPSFLRANFSKRQGYATRKWWGCGELRR